MPQAVQPEGYLQHDETGIWGPLGGRTGTAVIRETCCKVLYHNGVMTIHRMYGLGTDPVFWGGEAA